MEADPGIVDSHETIDLHQPVPAAPNQDHQRQRVELVLSHGNCHRDEHHGRDEEPSTEPLKEFAVTVGPNHAGQWCPSAPNEKTITPTVSASTPTQGDCSKRTIGMINRGVATKSSKSSQKLKIHRPDPGRTALAAGAAGVGS